MTATRATVLDRILAETRRQLQERKRDVSPAEIEAQAAVPSRARHLGARGARGPFHEALAGPKLAVIAEFKRRSPSAGSLHEEADIEAIVGAYERGGASACSVLTESPNFGGSLDDLRIARAACGLPILRKDFIVDPYQLYEARAAGADAVLLIVAALDQTELGSLHALAGEIGLDALVEVHDSEELARAAKIDARLIGVNNRDLRDFSVDLTRTSRLLAEMPAGALVVSESGISTPGQLRELECEGVAAVLVGGSLMGAVDPQRALAELLSGPPTSSGVTQLGL